MRRRPGSDRGAALLEFAIIMPVLCLLLFGIIEFASAFNDYQSVRQGARDGARNSVVKDYGTSTSCGITTGSAATAPANAQKMICTVKDHTGVGNNLRVLVRYTESAPGGFTNDTIKVCSAYPVQSITHFLDAFISGKVLKTEVEMRVEKSVDLVGGTYAETDPSGAGWSWC
jgi:Flp pilus assembly protein TadG